MKIFSKALIFVAALSALCFSACKGDDEPEVPEPEPLEIWPEDINVLVNIMRELGMDAEDYPVNWNLEDTSTWKGIELDTITDTETGNNYLAINGITIYLTREKQEVPRWLQHLYCLKKLRIYGCAGSCFFGLLVPNTVESLLVDRLNPEDPGYIEAVTNSSDEGIVNIAGGKGCLEYLVMHGVNMKSIYARTTMYATIDLSYNTLEGDAPWRLCEQLSVSANLSHNHLKTMQHGWDAWIYLNAVPNLQYNDISDIPAEVIESDFWKEYSDCFIGNPGYVAPEQ